jgi:HD-GYP domain-containing protein (c-di-GMP phosphodiesterase class II)
MKLNLNQFLISVSFVLDFIEIDILDDITNHSKRVGFTALKIAEILKLSEKERFALLAFAIMHDIGGVENKKEVSKNELEKIKGHCIIGEQIIENFSFTENYSNVLLYHHENYDGSGFFNKEKDEIPLFSQIIALADHFELMYNPDKNRDELISGIKRQKNKKFSEEMVNNFLQITRNESFWLNLEDEFVFSTIKNKCPKFADDYSSQEIHKFTALFSGIIDSKSKFTKTHSTKLSKKAKIIADFYNFSIEKRDEFIIAADLHDLGKIAISNSILDKPGKLNKQEFRKIKSHSYYTRKALETIDGFNEITEWAANHHEKLDGTGYPYGLTEEFLDFPSQIMAVLDIYQALTENRPYRNAMNHHEAMKILNHMVIEDKINTGIVNDIDKVFK